MQTDIASLARLRYTTKAFNPERRIPEAQIEQLCELLRNAPSSVNAQPWHFVLASSPEARMRITRATQDRFLFNEAKVRNASHVIVLCARNTLDDEHLSAVLEQEQADGRFPGPEARAMQDNSRRGYVAMLQNVEHTERAWIGRQVYIALGTLLLGAAALGIDACTMEGFDAAVLDEELGLPARGLRSVVLVALGYRAEDDFNATLPKSRLTDERVFSRI